MNTEFICADCSSPRPSWASINRGVLVCDECCSVHRSLGRHISYIRSLQSSNWPPVLREMVSTLVQKGANSIWEHALHDTHSKVKIKKPSPRDKLHPTKHDFIVAKYKYLLLLPKFMHKDNPNSVQDLSKQLHASVRTSNLDTCLRLLSLGADPNFLHHERGNTPLHVAAQAGQAMQVELLVVYGANPSSLDRLGHTPEECARIAGHHQLADRLIECQYELTDKLSFFLCGRKPVHSIGEHYLVNPQTGRTGSGKTEARSRLQELTNDLFEEMATDVYDEVDRRETDAIWLTTQQLQSSVAFLPVNTGLSPLRNQGRQKLATLDAQEFASLLVDILNDTKRRQTMCLQTGQQSGNVVPSSIEDRYDHDYDEVPVESERKSMKLPPDPYGGGGGGREQDPKTVPTHAPKPVGLRAALENPPPVSTRKEEELMSPKELHVHVAAHEVEKHKPAADGDAVSHSTYNRILEKLKLVEKENKALQSNNDFLQQQLHDVQKQLNKVIEENYALRSATNSPVATSPPAAKTQQNPVSSEPTFDPTHLYAQVEKKQSKKTATARVGCASPSSPHQPETTTTKPHNLSSSEPLSSPGQDTPLSDSPFDEGGVQPPPPPPPPPAEATSAAACAVSPPTLEEVHGHVKGISQCIQELLQAAQSHRQNSFGPCSKKIALAVETMAKVFPPKQTSQEVQVSLREVALAAKRLQGECLDTTQSDLAYHTRHIINSAYDVAKASRHLVLCVEQEQSS